MYKQLSLFLIRGRRNCLTTKKADISRKLLPWKNYRLTEANLLNNAQFNLHSSMQQAASSSRALGIRHRDRIHTDLDCFPCEFFNRIPDEVEVEA
jgi:hypothetical protein